MTLRRLPDDQQLVNRVRCPDTQHNPPAYADVPAGSYIHSCPTCRTSVRIEVSAPTLSSGVAGRPVSHVAPLATDFAAEVAHLHRTLAACPRDGDAGCAICAAARERLTELIKNPEGAFLASGTGVRTVTVTMRKGSK